MRSTPPPMEYIDYAIVLNRQDDAFYQSMENIRIHHKFGVWKYTSLLERLRKTSFRERTETEKMLFYIKGINPKLYRSYASLLPQSPIPYSVEKKILIEDIIAPLREGDKTILVLSPIKEGASKVVADSFYPTIIQTILSRFPHIVIIVVISEGDRAKGEAIMHLLPRNLERCMLFINNADLSTLVALIDMCDIFLGSSSGPTHIAGLLNKKVIALYPHNKGHSPKRWGVQGRRVRYVLAEKRVDELPKNHPKRFGTSHLEAICSYIREFCAHDAE